MDECKHLPSMDSRRRILKAMDPAPAESLPPARGLHSFTFRLNVSAFCGIAGASMGCLGGV